MTGITLFAEVVEDSASVYKLIEQAIATKEDPPALLDTAQRIMTDGFDLSCEFINMLCQEFDQYWLRTPDPSGWRYLLHYSKPRAKWCTLRLSDQFLSSFIQRRPSLVSRTGWRHHILLKMIRESDLERMRVAGPAAEPTFAEEMLATALVELAEDRIRSAIRHAVIGYESAVKRGLDTLLKTRLKGLESAAVL